MIVAAIGPLTIPALVRHLRDANEHVRAVAIAALGHLHAVKTVPLLVALYRDRSDLVRQNLVEALGSLGTGSSQSETRHPKPARFRKSVIRMLGWLRVSAFRSRSAHAVVAGSPVDLAVAALETALADSTAAVRTQARDRWAGLVRPRRAAGKLKSLDSPADGYGRDGALPSSRGTKSGRRGRESHGGRA